MKLISIIVESPNTNYFMYVENGRSGVMKRSGMDINIESPIEALPLYSVSYFLYRLLCIFNQRMQFHVSVAIETDYKYLTQTDCTIS